MAENKHLQDIIRNQCKPLHDLLMELTQLYQLNYVQESEKICSSLDTLFNEADKFVTAFETSITTDSWSPDFFDHMQQQVNLLSLLAHEIHTEIHRIALI